MAADRVLVLGLDLDPNIAHLVAQLRAQGIQPMVGNLRELVTSGHWCFVDDGDGPRLVTPRQVIRLAEVDGVFWRPIDLGPYIPDPAARRRWTSLMAGLKNWLFDCSRIPTVVNPVASHKHNRSKPLHESFLQALGLNVPCGITSSDPAELQQFVADGPAVVKPISGTGARVRRIGMAELAGPGPLGPLHLQRQVTGLDIRAFVVGAAVISLGIVSSHVDYHEEELAASYVHRVDLPDDVQDQLVSAARLQTLPFTGWDLKLDRDGVYWFLECNPMPSFAPFDSRIDGEVANELIQLLTNGWRPPRDHSLPYSSPLAADPSRR